MSSNIASPGIIVDLRHLENIVDFEYPRVIRLSVGLSVLLSGIWQVTVPVKNHSASTAIRSDYTHTHSRFLLILPHPLIFLLPCTRHC